MTNKKFYFYREKKLSLANFLQGIIRAFILGVILALGWTPWIGPILSALLSKKLIEKAIYFNCFIFCLIIL